MCFCFIFVLSIVKTIDIFYFKLDHVILSLVPQDYLYGQTTTYLTYNDFINKELILFSNSDNERSIPSMVDGEFYFYHKMGINAPKWLI